MHSTHDMQLLYFAAHPLWPPNSGARLRDFQLARQLSSRCLVNFVEMLNGKEPQCPPPVDSGLAGIITLNKGKTYSPYAIMRGLLGPTPVTVLNCWSRRSAINLAGVLRSGQYDSVQIEGTQLMAYLHVIQESRGQHPIVIDWHNVESELVSRYANTTRSWLKKIAAARTATLLERAEDKLLESSLTHTVASERERKKLLARCPNANIHIIPNGVDAAHFSASEMAEAGRRNNGDDSRRSILFVGSMDYHANVDAVMWFSRKVWPEISRQSPGFHFT